jgi:hypothetical protein
MTILEWAAVLRGIGYLWVAATSLSISQLYTDGYAIAKKESAIITRLIGILTWLSVIFFYLSITAFAQAFNIAYHEIIVALLPMVIIPLGYKLNKFRAESIKKNDKEK